MVLVCQHWSRLEKMGQIDKTKKIVNIKEDKTLLSICKLKHVKKNAKVYQISIFTSNLCKKKKQHPPIKFDIKKNRYF